MNERIKQLAGQAKVMAEQKIDLKIPYSKQLEGFAEQFAELIVRECIRTIARQELMSHPEYKWTDKEIGYNEGINTVKSKLKELLPLKDK